MNYLLVIPKGSAKAPGGHNVFPVGIAYVSAALRENGYRVFTANLEFCEGDTFFSLEKLIRENNIDVIGTSGLSRDYGKVKEIVDTARRVKPDIISVVGGGIMSSDPETAMSALGPDIGVIGEGEVTMCELAAALDHNGSYADVPGLIYQDGEGGYVLTGMRTESRDIDTLPLPDYDGFSYLKYMESINYAVANIVASRSCPFSCTFCYHPSGKKYRQRSLDNLFVEIDYLLTIAKVRNLGISDELFANNRERVMEFCRRISPYKVNWGLQLRVSDVDAELLDVMRDAGCVCISFGLESMDNSVLKSMKKHITAEQIEHALKITYDANIEIQGCFIFGDTAETKSTAERTLKWHEEHPCYGIDLNMINIFPGTQLYNIACERGIINDKVKFLKEGCPLVNVSTLADEEYKELASRVYEKNVLFNYSPETYTIGPVDENGNAAVEIVCRKCGATIADQANVLHRKKMVCSKCGQRHYVDPFEKLAHSAENMARCFEKDETVALWGAGELCIKLLDTYALFHADHCVVVDSSMSRQGYFVRGKRIFSPEIINEKKIGTVLIAVVNRMDEIRRGLNGRFPSVTKIYAPDVEERGEHLSLVLRTCEIEENRTREADGSV